MRTILVVTHAQSQHHVDGIVGGWYDTGLTDLGRDQARRAAERVRELVPADDPKIYSSDLKRACQTAEAISTVLQVPVAQSDALREISFGEAEGKPQAWLDARFVPYPATGNRMDHLICPGAETRRQFARRLYRAMDTVYGDGRDAAVVVTHGFALTFIVSWWIGLPQEETGYVNFASSPAGITGLAEDDWLHNRGVKFVNDTAHLAGLY